MTAEADFVHDVASALRHRTAVPWGMVPDFVSFKRRVWGYEDEHGFSPIGAPPKMFSAFVASEDTLLREHVLSLRRFDPEKVDVIDHGAEYEVAFHDLDALHRILLSLAEQGRNDRDEDTRAYARATTERFLWLLGYRWA